MKSHLDSRILLNNLKNGHFNIDATSILNFGSGTIWKSYKDQDITNKFYITGNTTIVGCKNAFNLSTGGLISIADGATLTLSSLVISSN
jgi:hypothetical protein